MARPTKDGLDYFPLDCVLDDKMELLEAEHGSTGFMVVIKLWQLIYKDKGYFYPWTEREQKLLPGRINVDKNTIRSVIEYATKIGIFDSKLSTRGILTSTGIQKRYVAATARRTNLFFFEDLLLIKREQIPRQVGVSVRNITFGRYFCPQKPKPDGINDGKSTQSKVKESKEKKRAITPPVDNSKPVDNSSEAATPEDIQNLAKVMKRLDEKKVV